MALDDDVAALLNSSGTTATKTATTQLVNRETYFAPKPTGVRATDQANLQGLINAGAMVIHLHPGTYRVSALSTLPAYAQPKFIGAGRDSTYIEGSGSGTAITFNGAVDGAPGLIYSGGGLSDLAVTNAGVGVEVIAVIGAKFCELSFQNLTTGVLFHNKSAGQFTEFSVVHDSWFRYDVKTAVEYRVTAGDSSFHGCGIAGSTIIEQPPTASAPSILIGANAYPYNAPLSFGVFMRSNTQPVILSNTDHPIYFYGDIRVEGFPGVGSGSKIAVTSGTHRLRLLGGVLILASGFGSQISQGDIWQISGLDHLHTRISPFTVDAGEIAFVGAASNIVDVAITFAYGRFSKVPIVTCSVESWSPERFQVAIVGRTLTGFTVKVYMTAGAVPEGTKILWQATQVHEFQSGG